MSFISGEKKTPACKRLTTPITKLETEIQEGLQAAADVDEDRPTPNKLPPQLLVEYFSFEELFNLMDRSGCQVSETFIFISMIQVT